MVGTDAVIRVLLGMISEQAQSDAINLGPHSMSGTAMVNSPIDVLVAINNIESRRIYSANLLVPIIIEVSKLKSINDSPNEIIGEPKLKINKTIEVTSQTNFQTDYLNQLIEEIKQIKPTLETLLRAVKDYRIDDDGVITLTFNYIFHKDKLEKKENLKIIEEIASKIHAKTVRIRCQVNKRETTAEVVNLWDNFSGNPPNDFSSIKPANSSKPKSKGAKQNEVSPDLLKVAQEVFGGQLIE